MSIKLGALPSRLSPVTETKVSYQGPVLIRSRRDTFSTTPHSGKCRWPIVKSDLEKNVSKGGFNLKLLNSGSSK